MHVPWQLLARGNRVIAGVRNPEKSELLTPLREQYGDKLWVVPLDVSDSASIKVPGHLDSACTPPLLSAPANDRFMRAE